MLHEDLIQRSTQTIDTESYKPWGYVSVLLDRFAPWPLFILASCVMRVDRFAAFSNSFNLLWLWAMVPLVAFSLARTQHHWYLDPSYPAWSILASIACLNLMTLRSPQARMVTVSLLVCGLLLCETRILFRVYKTDRRPVAQAFLLSLGAELRLPADTTIMATFPLSHSERFILQVVDGYRVIDPKFPRPAGPAQQPGQLVMLARRQETIAAESENPQASMLAAGAGYILLKLR